MERLWKLRVEIEVKSGDLNLKAEYMRGFMNVVTWAISDESAKDKLTNNAIGNPNAIILGTFHSYSHG